MLQCVAVCCSVLQCVAVCVEVCYSVSKCECASKMTVQNACITQQVDYRERMLRVCWECVGILLQCVAVCCSVLLCTSFVYCSCQQDDCRECLHNVASSEGVAVRCSVLQLLQCVTVCCSGLQREFASKQTVENVYITKRVDY